MGRDGIIEGDDLDSLRNDLRASLRRAKAYRRDLGGTPAEVRMVLLVEALDRCVKDLTHLLLAAERGPGLYSGRAVEGPESHGARRQY